MHYEIICDIGIYTVHLLVKAYAPLILVSEAEICYHINVGEQSWIDYKAEHESG